MRKYIVRAVWTVILLSAFAAFAYDVMILAGQVRPVFAQWLLATIGSVLSYATYLLTRPKNKLSNIGNIVDVVANASVVVAMLVAWLAFDREMRIGFNTFEWICLGAMAALSIWWFAKRKHEIANYVIQGIVFIAYVPLWIHLWGATETTEPTALWVMIWVAALIAFVLAKVGGDRIAIVYNTRRLFVMSVVIVLLRLA